MATQLSIYNHALLTMKERRLASLGEDRESRRVLDEFYTQVVQFCLEQGMWTFAMRSATLTSSGSGAYGFTKTFAKPSDYIHLFTVSENASFDPPLVYGFANEGSFLYGNVTPIYIRYSSNDPTNGGGLLTKWPQGFAEYVAGTLAAWSCYAITGNERVAAMIDQRAKVLLFNALSLYSLVAQPGMLPFNTLARSTNASEANNLSPGLLPFGAELRAMMASQGGQGGQGGQNPQGG